MGRLFGNRWNNNFLIYSSDLEDTRINARGGFDTLHIEGSEELNLDETITDQWRNIERVDFSDYGANVFLAIDEYLLSKNGKGQLEIVSSDNGEITLSAEHSEYGTVLVSGDGNVQLADGIDNVVEYGIGEGVITGGTGNDTITAGVSGNELNGGSGNDVLVGGIGSDVFVFESGDGQDQFQNFDLENDQIELTDADISGFYELVQLVEDGPDGAVIGFPNGGSIILNGIAAADVSSAIFTVDGEPLPYYSGTITVQPGTSAAELNALIKEIPAGTTIVLSDGVHVFTETISIMRDDITISGESEAGTVLSFTFPEGTGGSYLQVTGGDKTYVDNFNSDAAKNSNHIQTDDGHGLSIGDIIYIYQPNTQEYLDENGWSNVDMADAGSRPFREFITTVQSIEGGIITLEDPLPFDFEAVETRIFSVDMIDNVSITNLTITNDLGDISPFSFVNDLGAYDGDVALDFGGTNNLVVSGLTILNAPSTAIGLTTSINAEISDIYIDGSHNMGGGGNGYGIELAEAFNNSLTGLEIFNVRHSVVFSAWNTETNNNVKILDTNRDVNFHGGPDSDNSVFVFSSILEYDPSQDAGGGSVWSIVSGGGSNHAATDIFNDNNIRFAYGEGSNNVDTIHGHDGGAYLNGHGSNDVLVGGAGQDVIVGGLRRDILTGGENTDLFIFKMGDDLDRITDFEFGPNGDLFVVMGNVGVTEFSDLAITQDGDDVRVRYGSNSTVILEDVSLEDVVSENFIFDPYSQAYEDLWMGM